MFGAGAGGFGAFTQAPGITVTTFIFIEYKQIVRYSVYFLKVRVCLS